MARAKQAALSITGKPSTPIIYGQEFTLSADGGSGRGAVTWAVTSNPAYATVDNTGKVQITGVGAVGHHGHQSRGRKLQGNRSDIRFYHAESDPIGGYGIQDQSGNHLSDYGAG